MSQIAMPFGAAHAATAPTILVVEDHQPLWPVIRRACRKHGWKLRFVPSGEEALQVVEREFDDLDLVVVDICLPRMNGIELLERIHSTDAGLPVIVLTGQLDAGCAVKCMRAGASDYITKPFLNEDLALRLRTALERRRLLKRVAHFEATDYLSSLMGPSQAVSRLAALVSQVAPTDLSVLIEGESGTGKELVARRIHALSRRTGGPFIPVDCGAIPESLIESELFGSKKGSFTGATQDRKGVFQAASGGTLFLDEIGNLPLAQQARLLRALQEKRVTPIGGTRATEVDVRVVAASNASLLEREADGEFRLDLFHRVAEFPIEIPPLRDRLEDLLFLCARFLKESCEEFGKQIDGFGAGALEQLLTARWPGNVRELRSAIRRAALLNENRIGWWSSLRALHFGAVAEQLAHGPDVVCEASGHEGGGGSAVPLGQRPVGTA